MHVRCPHCYNPIQIVADQTLTDIECPSCGSHFQLLSEGSTKTYRYEPATQIGQFELVEVVGAGRYGAVWKARDIQLDRTVAIKIPRAETLSASESEQFLREARAAAQVKHSNIVSVLEVGRHEETLYIVSDFIDGVNLRQWLSQNRLSPKEAAKLTATIAGALHQAHEAGVIHRDLKPSNIMIDYRGEPFIADFGLAKREAGEITITMDGRVLGTPAYMPPEQASGHGHDADRRADVYALGVVLFEMLTGETPFRGEQRMLIMQILHDDPPGPRQLNSRVPRDLNTICLKCLEKKPEARYQTAAELSDDLNRFLRGEPIHARPISQLHRTARWCRRNPTVAALLSLVILTLATGAGVSSYFAWQSSQQAAQLSAALYESLLSQIQVTREARVQGYREIVEELAAEARQLDTPAYDRTELRHELVAAMGDFVGYAPVAFEDFPSDVTYVALNPEGTRLAIGFENGDLELRSLDGSPSRQFEGAGAAVRWLRFSQDGRQLTAADHNGMIQQWDLTLNTGEPQLSWRISTAVLYYGHAEDHELLVLIAAEQVEIWNIAEMRQMRSIATPGLTIRAAALSVRGDILAAGYSEAGGDSSGLIAWNAETGEQLMKSPMELGRTYQNAIDFSEDGRYLAIGFDRALLVYDANDLTQLAVRRWDATKAVAFHPRKPYVTAVDIRGRIMLWNPLTGRDVALLHNWRRTISRECLAFDGDGSMLVSSNASRVHIWDLEAADERRTLIAHQGGVPCLAFSHDGAWLASGGKDHVVHFWDAGTGTHRGQFGVRGPVQTITFSSDDRILAIGYWGEDGEGVEILDFGTRKPLVSLQPNLGRTNCLKLFKSSGEQYLAGAGDEGFALWSVTSDDEQPSVRLNEIERQDDVDRCLYLAVSPDGRWIVYASDDRDLNLFDVSQRKPHSISAPAINQGWHGLGFFPDNKRFIYVSQQGTADAWDVVADQASLSLGSAGEFHAPHLALSRTGQLFAGLSGSDAVSVWDTLRQEKLFTLQPDGNAVWSLAWSPDERQLAVGFTDGRVALWDLDEVRQELSKLGLAW